MASQYNTNLLELLKKVNLNPIKHQEIKEETMNSIHTSAAPAAIGPYSQAIETVSTVYISGQLPIDPATGPSPLKISRNKPGHLFPT